jgi:hypothetical protein
MSFGLCSSCAAENSASQHWQFTTIVAATSDYVYRGESLRNGKPTPFVYFAAKSGIIYFNGLLIGTDLGTDALGRSIGTREADATIGITPSLGKIDFNFGAKYTGYPNGRDIIIGTLQKAERDFIEPFAGATFNVTDKVSVGGTVYWTPNFYYETGDVVTLEAQAGIVLPPTGALHSKLTAYAGLVRSEYPDVVSPGNGYVYYNVGVEAQVDRMLFDVRYWDTDVDHFAIFDQRFVVSMGVSLW